MKISVIVPNYNRAALIGNMLESLQAQTHSEWEALIVDDGSTDDSPQLIKKAAVADPRIQLISRGERLPKGAQTCRNIGIEKATGDFLLFFDNDDTMAPGCLAGRIAEVKARPGFECYAFTTDESALDEADKANNAFIHKFFVQNLPWITHDMLWRKPAVEELGCFDIQQQRFQDVTLHLKLLTRRPPLTVCFVYQPEKDWHYFPSRDHDASYYSERFINGYFQSAIRLYGAYTGPAFARFASSIRIGLLVVFRKHLLMAMRAKMRLSAKSVLKEYFHFKEAGILTAQDFRIMRFFLLVSKSPVKKLLKGRIIKHFLH